MTAVTYFFKISSNKHFWFRF